MQELHSQNEILTIVDLTKGAYLGFNRKQWLSGSVGPSPYVGFKTMANISLNAVRPVSFFKEEVISFVMNAVAETISSYKAKRHERRVEKILEGLDPRIVRDILPQ